MNVSIRSKTTVGDLLYPVRPSLDFERLVGDLDAALAGAGAETRKTTLMRNGLAVIDAGPSRIALAMAENPDRTRAAITVTVGIAPDETGDERLTRRQAVLARLIAERLAARAAPAETIWSESDDLVTPEFLERRVESLASQRDVPSAAKPMPLRPERPRRFVDVDDIPRLMARVDATLDARRLQWDASLPTDIPPLDLSALGFIEGESRPPSAPLRLAAHLMDATLMVLLLPVGAMMMIYSLSRGANVNNSARAMAVTGIGIGALQAAGGLGRLQSMLVQLG